MTRVTFTIPGKPWAKQRPRFSRRNGVAFTPKETVSFERTVGQIAMQHFPRPIEGPVRLNIIAVFEPPPSWSKKKRAEALERPHAPHTQKPDKDNIEKAICDGLNRIAFVDDAQVFDGRTMKVWGQRAETIVTVEEA